MSGWGLFLKLKAVSGRDIKNYKRAPQSSRAASEVRSHSGSHQAKNLMGVLMSVNYDKMPVYHTCRKYQCDGLWADNITFQWPDQYKQLK